MKQLLAAILVTTVMLWAVAVEAQTPRPILENQLLLAQQAISANQQRQDDYKRQGLPVPEFLTKQRANLEDQRRQIEIELKQR